MLDISLTLLPIFALLVLGNLLRRNGFPGGDFWGMADKMVYWVLFPALLFHNTSIVELDPVLFGDFAIVLLSAVVGAGGFSLLSSKIMGHSGPVAGSVFQGAARHNTFIAFAVAEALIGPEALAIAAVATSVLVAPTNLLCVTTLVSLKRSEEDGPLAKRLAKEIFKNPLLIAIAAGLSLNAAGIGAIPVIDGAAKILSSASLPVALLCVGAGLRIKHIKVALDSVIISIVGKLVIFPIIVVACIYYLNLTGDAAFVLIIYGAIPTSVTAHALARQLGGDAPLMAGIITVQTLIAVISMPLMLAYIPQLLQ